MKFSIITACRNSARYLPETIRSVLEQSALHQGIGELEYFIIDGASTDKTAEVVSHSRQAPITFISEPDDGLYDALAKGFPKASGDVVAYLNAGDILHEHAFRVASEVLSREARIGFAAINSRSTRMGRSSLCKDLRDTGVSLS